MDFQQLNPFIQVDESQGILLLWNDDEWNGIKTIPFHTIKRFGLTDDLFIETDKEYYKLKSFEPNKDLEKLRYVLGDE